jgi:hypothetical protein
MKKSRVFMAAGALALAITAVFATKANKRFTPRLSTGFLNSSDGSYSGYVKNSGIFTTSSGVSGFVQAYVVLCTSSGSIISSELPLYKTATGTDPVFINH